MLPGHFLYSQCCHGGLHLRSVHRAALHWELRFPYKALHRLAVVRGGEQEEMDTAMKRLCLLALLAVAGIAGMERADGAGECGRVPVDRVAFQVVTPCGAATRDSKVVVPGRCCAAVQRFGRNPICLCAIMLSTTSKNAGVKPEIAVTIPKRCNLADRPVGYKCGGQSVER